MTGSPPALNSYTEASDLLRNSPHPCHFRTTNLPWMCTGLFFWGGANGHFVVERRFITAWCFTVIITDSLCSCNAIGYPIYPYSRVMITLDLQVPRLPDPTLLLGYLTLCLGSCIYKIRYPEKGWDMGP